MPDNDANEARTTNLVIRVSPGEREKIRRLADWRGRPYADLVRENGINALLREHDRIVNDVSSSSAA